MLEVLEWKSVTTAPEATQLNLPTLFHSFIYFYIFLVTEWADIPYHTGCAALPVTQFSLYLCPASALVTCIIKTLGSFLRLLPVDMAISSAPVLTGEKSQVSRRQRETEEWMTSYPITCHLYTDWCRDLRSPHETSNYMEKDSDHRRGRAHLWLAPTVVFMS